MTPADQCPILQLPNEILMLIFHESACITDAWSLAQTCAQLYRLFALRRNKVNILRSAANVPKWPIYDLENEPPGTVYRRLFLQAGQITPKVDIMRIPPHNWAFPSAEYPDVFILVEFDYGPAAEFELHHATTVCDLVLLRTHRTQMRPFIGGLHDFLSQFLDLGQRWKMQFEPATEQMFAGAAKLQSEILDDLSQSAALPSDLSSEVMVLALALHLYLILRPFEIIDDTMLELSEDELFDEGSPVLVLDADYEHSIPSAEVHQKPMRRCWRALRRGAGAPRPGYDIYATPDLMTEHIAQVCFRLLDTRDPRHWPIVLFVLVLLYHAMLSLQVRCPWMGGIDALGEALQVLVEDLAHYYYISTEGGILISDRWNEAEYTALVYGDERAIRYARMLNKLWLETDQGNWKARYGGQGIEKFSGKLNYFAFGCVT
ncbi:hypothetical protein BJX63DRAFT_279400 [Aspergillus granulosus]|uniref:F-box domain-containing protein n=1 Tax=Aspergillus granulosus TaxID=176169 RepID=A0ABR4HYW6_9EURO